MSDSTMSETVVSEYVISGGGQLSRNQTNARLKEGGGVRLLVLLLMMMLWLMMLLLMMMMLLLKLLMLSRMMRMMLLLSWMMTRKISRGKDVIEIRGRHGDDRRC